MMITRDNYEIWFLDYLEGRLDKEHTDMVREFLRENPDLAEVTDGYMPELVAGQSPVYPRKERLKKAWFDDPVILESTAIAAMEGDLTDAEQDQFKKGLENNPDARKIVKILGSTKLQPDLRINFPGKSRLKRKTILPAAWIRIAAAAAMLMLAFFIFSPPVKKAERSSLVTAETTIPLKRIDPALSTTTSAESPRLPAEEAENSKISAGTSKISAGTTPAETISTQPVGEPLLAEVRTFVPIEKLEPKPGHVTTGLPVYADLVLIKRSAPVYYASGEIPLSEFFDRRLQTLNASQTKDSFTREEFKVAGLRLFTRIPGSHLTGKKGKDGRLKSISFNTQVLAFSIPVNQ